MAFNITQFRTNGLALDGARQNLFDVSLTFPTLGRIDAKANEQFRFTCKSAALPGATIGVVNLQYFGREVKLPGNRTFADWTITVLNDEGFVVRNAFEQWMGFINSHSQNLRASTARNFSVYTKDITVQQYGKHGSVIKAYKLIGAFPTDLAQIDLDWGSNDAVEEFSVTLSYQWWETVSRAADVTGAGKSVVTI